MKYKARCEVCNRDFENDNEANLKRTIGFHRRIAHGIKGPTGRERYYIDKKGMTLEQAQAHIASKTSIMKWRKDHPRCTAQQNGETVAAKLSECPCCGTRFYMVKGAV